LTALRSRALLVLVLSAPAAGLSAQTTRLELGKTIQGDLTGGETRVYSVKLKTNQYLRAAVTEPSAALVVELHAPDGKKVLGVDTREFPGKPSRIVWVADTTGEYRISVNGAGRYGITMQELRKADTRDRKRVEAEQSFTQGLSEARKYAYEQAILSYTRALALYREVQDRVREEDALAALGAASDSMGEREKAIGYQEQVLAIAREIKDRSSEAVALKSLGNAYTDLSQYEKAIGYHEQAVAIFRDIKDRNGEGRALANIGTAYASLSQSDKAIGYYEQALPISREVKDPQFEAGTLYGLGDAYTRLNQFEKAVSQFEMALTIYREINDRRLEGDALSALGWSRTLLGQYEKAIGSYEQALAIEHETRNKDGEGWTLANLGTTYAELGEYQRSIGYYEQTLAIARETKERGLEGKTLENLGWSYSSLKQYEKAIAFSEQALTIEREIKDREGESETLNVLGDAYIGLNQNEKAIGYQERALAVSREIKDKQAECRSLNSLGDAHRGLGRYEKAFSYYEQALAMLRAAKDPGEAGPLSGLMDTWQASGRPRLAIFYGKQAVNAVQSRRSGIRGLSQDLQRSFLKDNEKPYHTLAEILIAQGRLAEAEQVLALLKQEEYFQYIRRDLGEASSLNGRLDLTPDEADYEKRYHEICDRLMTIGGERGELLALAKGTTLSADQSQRLDKLEQDLTVGNQAFEHFLGDLTEHFGAKPEIRGRIETLRESQGIMEDLRELPAGTVAIFTLIGDDKFHAVLRTPDAQKAYEYPIKAADLNRKISEFREVLLDPTLDPRPLAQELYKILIAGMAEDLRQAKAQTLMWSLDGALRYVPLAALYDGKQYLIEQYRVSVMTLASNTRLKDRPDLEWKAAGFGVTKRFEDASELPSVSSELEGIIATKPGEGGVLPGEIKLDGQFTQQSMHQTLRKGYAVVHIASHFRFQPGNDTKSFLLMGDGGHLTLAELKTSANLFGGVQLLTLSACNTGMGDGAEVEGFGALAQRQGAKAVVASLWPVADESTSRLMQEFYRIRESSAGMTKLEALREAQLRLLHGEVQIQPAAERDRGVVSNGTPSGTERPDAPSFPLNANAPYAHPFYWAAFFLMGNWL
jgi:CHAT domain-containing protein/uncharacterized protein HemY